LIDKFELEKDPDGGYTRKIDQSENTTTHFVMLTSDQPLIYFHSDPDCDVHLHYHSGNQEITIK